MISVDEKLDEILDILRASRVESGEAAWLTPEEAANRLRRLCFNDRSASAMGGNHE